MKKKAILLLMVAVCAMTLCVFAGCQGKSENKESDTDAMKKVSVENEPFYVLVVGNDSRTGTVEPDGGDARSDTMMLVRVDPKTYKIAIVTIPRDTANPLDGKNTKLNYVYQYKGIDALVDAVKGLTGATPKYYLDLNFVEFEKFVNDLGGVHVNVPVDMSLQDIVGGSTIELTAGDQDLDGAQALVLARVRKIFESDQDSIRQMSDRNIVEAGIKKVAADPVNAATHAGTLLKHAKTNWGLESLTDLVKNFSDNADKIVIYKATGPYAGDIDEESGEWLTTRDEATWAQIINTIESGEDPSGIVPMPEIKLK